MADTINETVKVTVVADTKQATKDIEAFSKKTDEAFKKASVSAKDLDGAMSKVGKQASGITTSYGKAMEDAMSKVGSSAKGAISNVDAYTNATKNASVAIPAAVNNMQGSFQKLTKGIDSVAGGFASLIGKIGGLSTVIGVVAGAAAGVKKLIEDQGDYERKQTETVAGIKYVVEAMKRGDVGIVNAALSTGGIVEASGGIARDARGKLRGEIKAYLAEELGVTPAGPLDVLGQRRMDKTVTQAMVDDLYEKIVSAASAGRGRVLAANERAEIARREAQFAAEMTRLKREIAEAKRAAEQASLWESKRFEGEDRAKRDVDSARRWSQVDRFIAEYASIVGNVPGDVPLTASDFGDAYGSDWRSAYEAKAKERERIITSVIGPRKQVGMYGDLDALLRSASDDVATTQEKAFAREDKRGDALDRAFSDPLSAIDSMKDGVLSLDDALYAVATGSGVKALSEALGAAMDAWITGTESGADAAQAAVASLLKGWATSSAVRALMELGEGFASLALGPIGGVSAAAHFKSAAIFGGVAAVAGSAAKGAYSAGWGGSTGSGASAASSIGSRSESSQPATIVVNVGDGFVGDPNTLGEAIDRAIRKASASGRTSTSVLRVRG